MYAYIIGVVQDLTGDTLTLENHGIGYEIFASSNTIAQLESGEKVKIYTRHIVREDASLLYGFRTEEERAMFDRLTRVSAVGPKSALAILSALSVEGVIRAVQTQDFQALTKAPGIGKKTAGRIVLELTDALKDIVLPGNGPFETNSAPEPELVEDLALDALLQFGYSRQESLQVLESIDQSLPITQRIRMALQKLG